MIKFVTKRGNRDGQMPILPLAKCLQCKRQYLKHWTTTNDPLLAVSEVAWPRWQHSIGSCSVSALHIFRSIATIQTHHHIMTNKTISTFDSSGCCSIHQQIPLRTKGVTSAVMGGWNVIQPHCPQRVSTTNSKRSDSSTKNTTIHNSTKEYEIGTTAQAQDVIKFTSKQEAQNAVYSLSPGSPLLVKRTNSTTGDNKKSRWTYAKFIRIEKGTSEDGDTVVVSLDNTRSSKKHVGKKKWHSCLCLVNDQRSRHLETCKEEVEAHIIKPRRRNSPPTTATSTYQELLMYPPTERRSTTRFVCLNNTSMPTSEHCYSSTVLISPKETLVDLYSSSSVPITPTVNLNARTFSGSRRERMKPMRRRSHDSLTMLETILCFD